MRNLVQLSLSVSAAGSLSSQLATPKPGKREAQSPRRPQASDHCSFRKGIWVGCDDRGGLGACWCCLCDTPRAAYSTLRHADAAVDGPRSQGHPSRQPLSGDLWHSERHANVTMRSEFTSSSIGATIMKITTIGVDLAKQVFRVHGVDALGKVILCRKLKRSSVLVLFANLPPCLVGMEACSYSNEQPPLGTSRP